MYARPWQQQRVKVPIYPRIAYWDDRYLPFLSCPSLSWIRVPNMRCIQQIVLLVPGVTYTTLSLPSLRRRRRLPIHPYSTRSHQSLHHPPHLNLRASPLLSILKGSNGTAFHSSQARFPLHVPLASLVSDTYTIRPQNNFQISVGGVKKRRIHECILEEHHQ